MFEEASARQATIMANIMKELCTDSGKNANTQKSKLFTSKNTVKQIALHLSQTFGIPLTEDLGVYLGILVVHGRLSHQLLDFIVSKCRKKLGGWKNLSRAARYILIRSVMSTILCYAMETLKLAAGIISDLENINRQFFWGDDDNHKKHHSIAFSELCKEKEDGVG